MQFLVNDFLTHLKLVSTLRFVISSGMVKILLYYVIRKRIIMLIQVNLYNIQEESRRKKLKMRK